MSLLFVTFTVTFFSCFCNLVNAENILGAYIGGSIGGLIVLILDVIAIVDVLRTSRSVIGKLLWILLIIVFPIGGLLIWLFCGRKTAPVL